MMTSQQCLIAQTVDSWDQVGGMTPQQPLDEALVWLELELIPYCSPSLSCTIDLPDMSLLHDACLHIAEATKP